jgi:hypothetical protein
VVLFNIIVLKKGCVLTVIKILYHFPHIHNGMEPLKLKFNARQAIATHTYKNLEMKVMNCNANIYFDRQCLNKKIVPSYVKIKPNDDPIDGFKHVAEVVLFNTILSKNRLCLDGDKKSYIIFFKFMFIHNLYFVSSLIRTVRILTP